MLVTYKINFACESVMLVVLLFLLVTCLLQRKRTAEFKPLSLLIFATTLLLICQLAEWQLMIASGDQTGAGVPAFHAWKVLTYTLDYFLGYASSLAYYHYVCEHIHAMYKRSSRQYPTPRYNMIKLMAVIGIVSTAIYGVFMTQDWFYYLLPDGSEMFNPVGYAVLFLISNIITVLTIITLFRHRKILGKVNFWLLMFYKISPSGLLLIDLLNSTCFTYLMRSFYTFILYVYIDLRAEREAAEKIAQLARQESELTELRTQIMLSQMQPHFFYNTLTTISALCSLDNSRQAEEIVNKFAVYFRNNMDSLGKDKYISFEKELEHIKTYLWIEKVRFDDDLTVEYKIGPTDFYIPSLTLQPLVENAVKHGICRKQGSGTVTIETQETEDEFLVIISDNGVGFDTDAQINDGRSHIGIENIKTRLEILCCGSLDIQSEIGVGTVATVHLPKENRTL